jgi:hypothetical protein
MTESRCDLAVLDEQLAANTAGRSGSELGVTVSIGVECVPDDRLRIPGADRWEGTR